MSKVVTFPGLGLEFHVKSVAFSIFGWPIHWYGIIIAVGFLLAVAYCTRVSKRFGIKEDDVLDLLFYAVPLSIIGARLYYVIFYLDLYRRDDGSLDFGAMVRIWDGGLAIYGGVIAAALTLLVFCKVKKLPFLAFADVGVYGLLIGQAVGRWGNFVNVEAYGGETTLPWRMGIYEVVNGVSVYKEVHPTFLYESLWNVVGLILLILVARRGRKFDGQIFLGYVLWYGFGRGLIEGLRTDSLYFFSTGIRVSQMLGFASALAAAVALVLLWRRAGGPEQLWVNRQKKNAIQEETQHGSEDP
ncbi:prolipoprotein diacylglyceryl transferase [Flavonifractor sp. An135]|nr:prolipoprotein diacylglyceryl transferase [Flavonifractor sp. An135]OUQ25238.1 prolipoprotein diacylglyceryl transferase [Flavonifractor sp. An135]